MKKLIFPLVVAVALLALMGACGSKPEYDPALYVALEYKYFNGSGIAVPVVTPPDAADKDNANIAALLEGTTFRYAPDNNLSNGDVVTVTPTYDEAKAEKKGFKPVVREVKFTVEGLPEGTPVDLWEWAGELKFGRSNGDGQHHFEFDLLPDDKQAIGFMKDHVYLSYDKTTGLSNGDVVTVTATYNQEQALVHGYKITSEPTKQFTVSGLK